MRPIFKVLLPRPLCCAEAQKPTHLHSGLPEYRLSPRAETHPLPLPLPRPLSRRFAATDAQIKIMRFVDADDDDHYDDDGNEVLHTHSPLSLRFGGAAKRLVCCA